MSELDPQVSIILLQCGREAYTHRWVQYARRVGLNSPIILADGNPSIAAETELKMTLPTATYLAFAQTYWSDFLRRVIAALECARTNYVQLSANDDFVLPSGVRQSVDFLNKHQDHVAGGAGQLGFYVFPEPDVGMPISGKNLYGLSPMYRHLTLQHDTPSQRVHELARGYVPIWYVTQRRECALAAFRTALDLDFADPHSVEIFVSYFAALRGKVYMPASGAFGAARQRNSWGAVARPPLVPDSKPDGRSGVTDKDFIATWIAKAAITDPATIRPGLDPKGKRQSLVKRLAFVAYLKSSAIRQVVDARSAGKVAKMAFHRRHETKAEIANLRSIILDRQFSPI